MDRLLQVYSDTVENASHGDAPVTLSFDLWIECRNDPTFDQRDRAAMVARLGSENAVDDFNAFETALEGDA